MEDLEREEDLSEDLLDLLLKRAFAFSRMAMVGGLIGGECGSVGIVEPEWCMSRMRCYLMMN